jgi:hypothetical protein
MECGASLHLVCGQCRGDRRGYAHEVRTVYKLVQARTLTEDSAAESGAGTHMRCVLYENQRKPERDVRAGQADRELWYDERYHRHYILYYSLCNIETKIIV